MSGARETSPPDEARRRAPADLFLVAIVAGVAYRLLLVASPLGRLNSDTAVVYLMARHAAHGELTTWYWGQSYGGTLVSLTAGLVFRLTGPSVAVLMVVAVAYWLAAVLVLKSLVTTLWDEPAGWVAATALWLPGIQLMPLSFADPGFYGPTLLLGLGSLRLACDRSIRSSGRLQLLLGACLGLAFWTSPLAVAFVVPAGVLACSRTRAWRPLAVVALGAVLGALPWLVANASRGFPSLRSNPMQHSLARRVVEVLVVIEPAALAPHLGTVLRCAVGAAVALLIAIACVESVRRRHAGRLALCASSGLALLMVVAAGNGLVPGTLRYAVFLLPGLAAAVASLVAGRRRLCLSLVTLLCVVNGVQVTASAAVGRPEPVPPSIQALAAALSSRHLTRVYADYWISYVLTAATDERITAAAIAPRRYRPYELAARHAPRGVIVVMTGGENERRIVARRLPLAETFQVAQFTVFVLDRPLDYFADRLPAYVDGSARV